MIGPTPALVGAVLDLKDLKRVRGKGGILLRLAEAVVAEPSGTVHKVAYPVAGETLKALAAEAAANAARCRAWVRMLLRSPCPTARTGT